MTEKIRPLKKPRFRDSARYPTGYVPAVATNIRATFERIRREQLAKLKAEKAEKERKAESVIVVPITRKAGA